MTKNNEKRGQYNTELTDMQKAFVENYLTLENDTKAYRIAYKQENENADYSVKEITQQVGISQGKLYKEIKKRKLEV